MGYEACGPTDVRPVDLGLKSDGLRLPCHSVVRFLEVLLWLYAYQPYIIVTGHHPVPFRKLHQDAYDEFHHMGKAR